MCQISDPTQLVCELPPHPITTADSSPDTEGTSVTRGSEGTSVMRGLDTGSVGPFDAIVSDLTQILCSQDEGTVISSAQ